jgi:hypothetical protein
MKKKQEAEEKNQTMDTNFTARVAIFDREQIPWIGF